MSILSQVVIELSSSSFVSKLVTKLHGTVKTNALVDRLTPKLQKGILKNNLDPMELPELDTEVTFSLIWD